MSHSKRWWQSIGSPRQRLALLVILLSAFAARSGWCLYAGRPPRNGDAPSYYFYGVEIARGHGYISVAAREHNLAEALGRHVAVVGHDIPTALFPPGYPGLLGGLFWFVRLLPLPENFTAAAVSLNVILSTATVLLAFEVTRRLFDTRAALLAAAFLAIYPNLVYHTASLHWETTFIFLTMATLLVLLHRPWKEGRVQRPTLVAFAVVLGFSVLVRPMSILFVMMLLVVALAAGAGARRALVQAGVALGLVGLMVLPWTVRNVVKLHSPVVLATELGPALCVSRQPGATGSAKFLAVMDRYCLPSAKGVPLDQQEVKGNNYGLRKAVAFVVRHPLREVRLWGSRARYAYREDHDGLADLSWFISSRRLKVLGRFGDWYFFAILGLAALGARFFLPRKHPERLFFLLATLSLASTPVLLFGDPRYKVPAAPLLTVVAAVGVVRTVDGFRNWLATRGSTTPTSESRVL